MVKLAESRSRRLIGLVCSADGCFLYGDEEKRIVEARPLYPPLIIMQVPLDAGFGEMIEAISPVAPAAPNALYMGVPAFRYHEADVFDVAIQFCHIPASDRARAASLRPANDLRQYFIQHL